MDFIEYLVKESNECEEFLRSTRPTTNQADIDATNRRLSKLTIALELYNQYLQRG